MTTYGASKDAEICPSMPLLGDSFELFETMQSKDSYKKITYLIIIIIRMRYYLGH